MTFLDALHVGYGCVKLCFGIGVLTSILIGHGRYPS